MEKAFKEFGITNFKTYLADENGLEKVKEKVDIILSVTVFQHIHKELTKKYLETAADILTETGYLIVQFYIDDRNPSDPANHAVFHVPYTRTEVEELFKSCNLKIDK